MTKVKNVVPYVAGIGALAAGAYLVKKQILKTPKQVTLTIPKGEYSISLTQESMQKPDIVAFENQRNYIKLK